MSKLNYSNFINDFIEDTRQKIMEYYAFLQILMEPYLYQTILSMQLLEQKILCKSK